MEKKEQANLRLLNQNKEMQRSVTELTRDKDKILQKLDDAYDKLKEDDKFVVVYC